MSPNELYNAINGLHSAAFYDQRVDWKEIWSRVREIGAEFRNVAFSDRAEREQVWQRYQEVVAEIQKQGEEARARRAEMELTSKRHVNKLEQLIEHAAHYDPNNLHLATGGLSLVVVAIEDMFGKSDWTLDSLKQRSDALKVARQAFADRKVEMLGRDKAWIYEQIVKSQERLNDDWAKWKEYRSEAKEQKKADFLAREEKRERWRTGQEAYIERLETNKAKFEDIIGRIEGHISELEDKRADARTDEYRERIGGWIRQEEEKISSLREKISDISLKIEEARSKL